MNINDSVLTADSASSNTGGPIPGLKPGPGVSRTWWVGILTAGWRKSCFQLTILFIYLFFTATGMDKDLLHPFGNH